MNEVTIGEVASVRSGYAFKSSDWLEHGIPVLKITNVKDGRVVLDGCSFVNEAVASQAGDFETRTGDILISMTGYIGEVALIRDEGRMLVNQRVGKFFLKRADLIDSRFLFYALFSPRLKAAFVGHGYGSAQPNISPSLIERQTIPLPPLPIQRRIASILSAYDDLIENHRKRIAILEDMARRLYREWFVHFRYPGHASVPLVDSPLGRIPQGWEAVPFDAAVLLQRGFDLPKAERTEGSIPIFAATGVNGYHNEAKVKAPGVVTGRSGSIGTVMLAWDDFWPLNTTLWVKEFRRLNPFLAFFLLKEMDLAQYNAGAAVPTLNRNDLAGINTVVAPTAIQAAFADQAGCQLRLADNLARQVSVLRRTRDLLLPRLMSGTLSVEALATAEAAVP